MTAAEHTIVVVSDLHANGLALEAALAQARAGGCDQLVVLGDLLSYGADDAQVLELVEAELAGGATLILGNHDALYLDLLDGDDGYYRRLPPWLREVADATAQRLDGARFRALPWRDDLTVDELYFAHAGPFGPRDWTYLNHEADRARARAALTERGARLGVFGHTHRPVIDAGPPVIVNPGGLGQPRTAAPGAPAATLLRLRVRDGVATPTIEPVAYDVAAHLARVRALPLSSATVDKLCSFFAAGS